MDVTFILATITIIGTLAGIAGYLLMRVKFVHELALGKRRQEELVRQAYETAVLKEIGERTGYSLSAAKIVEIISGSLSELLEYSTISHIILDGVGKKAMFVSSVRQSVAPAFINRVKSLMLSAISEVTGEPLTTDDVEESTTGVILAEKTPDVVHSFFNLPIVISGKLVGMINVASFRPNLYTAENTEVLYKIANQAARAVQRLQEVLENEKSRLLQAVQALSDGLLMVDTNFGLILVNSHLSKLLGIVSEPAIVDIVNALSGQLDLRTKMEEVVKSHDGVPPVEVAVSDKVLQVFATKVVNAKNEPTAIVVVFHDITDAKSLEKLRQDFMAVMVHELRAPLTSIKSTIDMVKEGLAKSSREEIDRQLGIVDSTSQTMLALVNDLLDVAKLEAGKFDIIAAPGDLAEVVSERAESFKAQAASKGLKINLVLGQDLGQAFFDKVRLKQVMNNLLSNAIKYTDSGEITVKLEKEVVNSSPVDILVSVVDTGIGIKAEDVGRLFSRFSQLEAGRGRAGLKSSGLGLYITKQIIEASGGKIWVESPGVGMGTTFYFTVPLVESKVQTRGFEAQMRIDTVPVNMVGHG